jgi:hypothetical protein
MNGSDRLRCRPERRSISRREWPRWRERLFLALAAAGAAKAQAFHLPGHRTFFLSADVPL